MIRIISKAIGWVADMVGTSLTIRTRRAREIVKALDPKKQYVIEIKEYRKKRSLDQNAMYWSILTQYARACGVSNHRAHNEMLRAYGAPLLIDGYYAAVRVVDSVVAEDEVLEAEDYHLKPTSRVEGNFRYYMIMRGSSTYDSKEMTKLMDGLLHEARACGIELIWEG